MDSLYNPYLVIPFATWLIAQLSKFVGRAWQGDVNWRLLYNSGGMPSAHSAVVTSLAATALIIGGGTSPLFGIAVWLAAIVMYDSFGVRRSSGDQTKAINAIIANLDIKGGRGEAPWRLREIFGHQPSEVLAGAILGLIVSLAMTSSIWVDNVSWLADPATNAEEYIYLAVFTGLILIGLVAHWRLGGKPWRYLEAAQNLKRGLLWLLQLPAWVGAGLVVLQKEAIPTWQWRLWPLLLIGTLVAVHSALAVTWYHHLPARIRAEAERLRRRRPQSRRRQKKRR